MYIVKTTSKKKLEVKIVPLNDFDFEHLKEERYFFNWKVERNHEVYKLCIKGNNDILGVISFEKIPAEWRIHIRLLTVSIENKGKSKVYERIAGCLIAFVAKTAVLDYGEMACISLRPKSQIAQHYINKYKMIITGMTLSIEVPEILNLINQYYDDEKER